MVIGVRGGNLCQTEKKNEIGPNDLKHRKGGRGDVRVQSGGRRFVSGKDGVARLPKNGKEGGRPRGIGKGEVRGVSRQFQYITGEKKESCANLSPLRGRGVKTRSRSERRKKKKIDKDALCAKREGMGQRMISSKERRNERKAKVQKKKRKKKKGARGDSRTRKRGNFQRQAVG